MRRTCSSSLASFDQGDVGEDVAAQGEVALGEAVEEGVGRRRGAGPGHAQSETVALAGEGDARPGPAGERFDRDGGAQVDEVDAKRAFELVAGLGRAVIAFCSRASSQAWTRASVFSRSSRPFLRSNTKRGSPIASRPKRVGGVRVRRR